MQFDNDAKIVHVATAPNETMAMMWRDILGDEGIMAAIRSGGSGYGMGHNLLNEQYIFVREDQFERARTIIDELEDEDDVQILWESS